MKKYLTFLICINLSAAVFVSTAYNGSVYNPVCFSDGQSVFAAYGDYNAESYKYAENDTAVMSLSENPEVPDSLYENEAENSDYSGAYNKGIADETDELLKLAAGVKSDDYCEEPDNNTVYDFYSSPLSYSGLKSEAETQSDFELKLLTRNINNSEKKITINAIVKNNTVNNAGTVIFSAMYDKNGTLKKLVKKDVNINADTSLFVKFDFSIEDLGDGEYSQRLFLWDANMKVLSESVDIAASELTDTAQTLTLDQHNMTLRLSDGNNSGRLTAEIYPEQYYGLTVNFESSDTSIATVDSSGVVTAVSPGTAYIYAITSDLGAMDQCYVTVTGSVTTDITLNQSLVNMWQGSTYILKAIKNPESDDIVIWSSSSPSVAEVSRDGLVRACKKGQTEITASVGSVYVKCTVNVYVESDYTGIVPAKYESNNDPARISSGGGDAGGKSYGCFQFSSTYNVPKSFYLWLIDTDFNAAVGTRLKTAHEADGGADYTFGSNFDSTWTQIAAEDSDMFRSCQLAYAKTQYYDSIYNKLKTSVEGGGLGFNPDNYGIALKSAIWSRALQHGVSGAFNVIKRGFDAIGGFEGKSERELIAAIYAECGMVVDSPPGSSSIAINDSTQTAVKYSLVGKYMKYFSSNSSSIQVGVWVRLNVDEPGMLYNIIDNPPVTITPQN